jgi:hypothetical protein
VTTPPGQHPDEDDRREEATKVQAAMPLHAAPSRQIGAVSAPNVGRVAVEASWAVGLGPRPFDGD